MSKDNSNNKNKKLLAQRHISSRMNFLFQASNLMATKDQSKLAAYYGKLCRNVGTKAVMHMAPALKRSLCRRCSLPLLPGVNTEVQVAREPRDPPSEAPPSIGEAKKTKKKRHRRQRKKRNSKESGNQGNQLENPAKTKPISLYLECSLCQSRRSFPASENQRDCWLEQPQSLVQVVSLPGER